MLKSFYSGTNLNWLLFDFVVYALAVWRISHMLVYEEGPVGIFAWMRGKTGIVHDDQGVPIAWPDHNVFRCLWCTSWWVSLGLLALPVVVFVPFAGSAVAIIINKLAR